MGYLRDHTHDLAHVLLAGVLMAVFYGALGCAVASFSDRRAVAAGSLIGLLLVSGFAGTVVGEGMTFSRHDWFVLLDLLQLPARVARWLFALPPIPLSSDSSAVHLDGWAYTITLLAVIVASLTTLLWRYQRMES
jgi:hypothetical protein